MSKRILLVEDEPGLVVTLSDRLASEGYAIESAGEGDLALSRVRCEPFDLIILDVMLPKKNGFDVCRDIRQLGSSDDGGSRGSIRSGLHVMV